MKFIKNTAFLMVVLVGLAASIVFVPSHRWWTAPSLVCLGGGILLYKEDNFRATVAEKRGVEYADDGTLFLICFIAACLVGLVGGLLLGAKWGTICSIIASVTALFVGYLAAEIRDDKMKAAASRAD